MKNTTKYLLSAISIGLIAFAIVSEALWLVVFKSKGWLTMAGCMMLWSFLMIGVVILFAIICDKLDRKYHV